MRRLKEIFLEIKNTITGDDKKAKWELFDIAFGLVAIYFFKAETWHLRLLANGFLFYIVLKALGMFKDYRERNETLTTPTTSSPCFNYCYRQILGKVPIFSYLFKRYYFEQITGLKQ